MSYGKLKESLRIFEKYANSSCLLGKLLYIPEDGAIKCQGGPFPGITHAFSALIVPQQASTETRLCVLPIMQLCA